MDRTAKKITNPANTIVAPDAVSKIMEAVKPKNMLRNAKIGENKTVCLKELLI